MIKLFLNIHKNFLDEGLPVGQTQKTSKIGMNQKRNKKQKRVSIKKN